MPPFSTVAEVRDQGCRVHRHEHVRVVARREDVARGEVDLERGDAVGRARAGARISAGKSGSVARSFPTIAVASVKRLPVSCIPSPESPANRTTTRSFFSTVLCSTGASSLASGSVGLTWVGMRVGVIGAGRIGSNAGTQLARSGHEVLFSGSRHPERLDQLAAEVPGASAGTPAEAVAFGEALIFSVPWTQIDDVLAQAGSLTGRVVIDTTNQYGPGGVEDLGGQTAVETNARRMPGALLAKAFNTLTSGFQQDVGDGRVDGEVAMFFATADESAAEVAEEIVRDCDFVPVRLAWNRVALMEAPRRAGSVYGEAYRPDEAARIAEAALEDPDRAAPLRHRAQAPGLARAEADHRRRTPAAAENRATRLVDPHQHAEAPARSRQPIGAQCAVRTRVLKGQSEGPVLAAPEPRRPVADRIAPGRVGIEVAVLPVHRDRPERVRRRKLPAREPDPVTVTAAQAAAAAVGDGGRVHGLRCGVGPEGELGNHRAAEVVAAVVADVVQRHEPAVVAHTAVLVGAQQGPVGEPRAVLGGRNQRPPVRPR